MEGGSSVSELKFIALLPNEAGEGGEIQASWRHGEAKSIASGRRQMREMNCTTERKMRHSSHVSTSKYPMVSL